MSRLIVKRARREVIVRSRRDHLPARSRRRRLDACSLCRRQRVDGGRSKPGRCGGYHTCLTPEAPVSDEHARTSTPTSCQWFPQPPPPSTAGPLPGSPCCSSGPSSARGLRTVSKLDPGGEAQRPVPPLLHGRRRRPKRCREDRRALVVAVVEPPVDGAERLPLALDDTPPERYGRTYRGRVSSTTRPPARPRGIESVMREVSYRTSDGPPTVPAEMVRDVSPRPRWVGMAVGLGAAMRVTASGVYLGRASLLIPRRPGSSRTDPQGRTAAS